MAGPAVKHGRFQLLIHASLVYQTAEKLKAVSEVPITMPGKKRTRSCGPITPLVGHRLHRLHICTMPFTNHNPSLPDPGPCRIRRSNQPLYLSCADGVASGEGAINLAFPVFYLWRRQPVSPAGEWIATLAAEEREKRDCQ